MNLDHDTAAWDAITTADLQDIAAFDRLAGRQAPASALQRYARQRRSSMAGPQRVGWQRLWAAVRRLHDEQKQLLELNQNRLDVSRVASLAATQPLPPVDTDVSTDAAPRDVTAAQRADRAAA